MKKILIVVFLSVVTAFAAPLANFMCDVELENIWFENERGDVVNWGPYARIIYNAPEWKTNIDDSIRYRVESLMTNETAAAYRLAVSATNHSITIPVETWEYINTHK